MDRIVYITERGKNPYLAPDFRIVSSQTEQGILVTSNTEPIVDDGQEHDWD